MKKKKPKLYGMQKYWPTLTQEQAEAEREKLALKQKRNCAICGKNESLFKNRLSVDHNHKSGQVRGLLCYRCNKFVVGRHTFVSAMQLIRYLKIERRKQP